MPDLAQSLQGRDLGHLRIVAQLWGVDLNIQDPRTGLNQLAAALLDRSRVREVIKALPDEGSQALRDLLLMDGQMPWSSFTRRYGAVREMGPARRDRERPYLNSSSTAEALWYRALVARAFFDSPAGPEEFAYIPEDLFQLIPAPDRETSASPGRPASPGERAFPIPASDRILDQACTLLAALRLELPSETIQAAWQPSSSPVPLSPAYLSSLINTAGLIDASGMPHPETARLFLEAPRGEALAQLARAWLQSTEFNELRLLPGLRAEGQWQNDPLRARQAILGFLSAVPGKDSPAKRPYWSLDSFVASIRQTQPDFQRPAGDYDSWFIREENSGEFLRGFDHWDEVDGALIRFILTGPLHWLGILDLAAPGEGQPVTAFRFSDWAPSLLKGSAPEGLMGEEKPIHASSGGRLSVPRLAPRAVRYQIARFSAWEGQVEDTYLYRLIPASLERARQQGLQVNHLLSLLRRHATAVPPSLVKALERWEERGSEARLEQVMVLRLSSPELLRAVRNSRAARFLGDPLGPTVVIVKAGAWKKVLEVLAEMGYLGEVLNGHE